MIKIDVGIGALLRWVESLVAQEAAIKHKIADALNYLGEQSLTHMVESLANQVGISTESARRLFHITPATADRPTFTIAGARSLSGDPISRPLPQPTQREFLRRPDEFFRSGELVRIVTFEDDRVCQICQDLAEDSPYTIEEARALIPAHPNCRCSVRSVRLRRELPVEMQAGRGPIVEREVTADELARWMRNEINLTIKAKR